MIRTLDARVDDRVQVEHGVEHGVARGSPKREAFVRLSGKPMVPYLVDPNTGTAMFESADIIAYLERTCGADERAA
ncbi:MAG TPA: glutathione S-transferase N-terminal domain-containing protein [Candidatus Limnocylindria bacterium]|nr:glutathione S-transferase N-terminal domain-containing protein [Candidatus Limnocylindria bacterium]